jgi:hypothetical protein
VLQAATTVEVHVWCSQLLNRRHLVQTKVKVWASNPGNRAVDVRLSQWYLLVPGISPMRDWSPAPGRQWPRPHVLNLPRGPVTAIPANPSGDAEDLGPLSGGESFSFATRWTKQYLGAHETWHTPLLDQSGNKYPDGTLVFYVPLRRRSDQYLDPVIIGLARMQNGRLLSLCPIGRWGPRVSAQRF